MPRMDSIKYRKILHKVLSNLFLRQFCRFSANQSDENVYRTQEIGILWGGTVYKAVKDPCIKRNFLRRVSPFISRSLFNASDLVRHGS